MSIFQNNKNQVKLIFLKDDIKCNNLSFYFYDERRNENVIRAVYDLIRNFCIQNIYYPSSTTPREADELIFFYNGKEIDNIDTTFNDLSDTSKNYTIYVVFRLLDKPLHQPSNSSNYLPNTKEMTMAEFGPENVVVYTGRGKKQTRNKNKKRGTKRTNKKYCNKCKTKKTLHHKHKYTNKNKNKK
jgi:hypothetical protein